MIPEAETKTKAKTTSVFNFDFDYAALGLKVGLEIHQQVASEKKLHCRCPNIYREAEDATHEIKRYLRPKANTLGMMDRAAVEQTLAQKQNVYKVYNTTCLGDLDEAGPAPINPEALKITLQVSKLFHMVPVDRVHTMRKIIVDGSGPCGYQRTSFIAGNGRIETESGVCRVASLCLEEESAPKMEEADTYTVFSLDRLGIPLIEIATEPDIKTPDQAFEVASYIGMCLRSTGKVKRGIGTIRQDVNVSIHNGARIEMKGVQALNMIEEIIKREVFRQLNLIKIRDELNEKGARVGGVGDVGVGGVGVVGGGVGGGDVDDHADAVYDVTDVFAQTKSKVLKNAADRKIFAICLKGFNGFVGREIQPGRRIGTELSDKAKAVGVSGLFHTDELPNYGITAEEVAGLRKAVGAEEDDAVIMMAGREKILKKAMNAVIERAQMLLENIPEETRYAQADGNSSYLRPLPGPARMYMETDLTTLAIDRKEYNDLEIPELLTKKAKRFEKEYDLNSEFATGIVFSKYLPLFEKLMSLHKGNESVTSTLLARTFTGTIQELKREGANIDISDEKFEELFDLVAKGALPKDAVRPVLVMMCDDKYSITEAVEKLGIGQVDKKEIEAYIHQIVLDKNDFVQEKGLAAVGPLMGIVMEKYRGKIDGKEISAMLKKEIEGKMK